MQEKAGQFRSAAFGGFHRQDVLHYIEQLTREHQANCERLERELTEERTARQQAEERLRQAEAQAAEAEKAQADLENTLAATQEELEHACRLAQADEFIQQFPDQYDTHIEQGGSNVSGGQKQRLCIARALLKKPKILILDDSTSAVDTRTDAQIRKALREYIPETTKIIIAQRISSVQDADFILVLDGGRIVEQGNHDELVAQNGIYREIFDSQTKSKEA